VSAPSRQGRADLPTATTSGFADSDDELADLQLVGVS
jgi:hypothetical protein